MPISNVRHLAPTLALALAASCSARNVARFHELGKFHAPNMHTLYPGVTHFVIASREHDARQHCRADLLTTQLRR